MWGHWCTFSAPILPGLQLHVVVVALHFRFYCPPVAEGWITRIFLSVKTVLAELLTLSLPLYAGGMFHWSVSWIVPWTSRVQSVFTFPRSLFISPQTQTDHPSPPLPHQRLQCEHSRAVPCLQACIRAGHVVSESFMFTWDDCCVFVVCGQGGKGIVYAGKMLSSTLVLACYTSRLVVQVITSLVLPVCPSVWRYSVLHGEISLVNSIIVSDISSTKR